MKRRCLVASLLACLGTAQPIGAQADTTHRNLDEWLAHAVRRPEWVRSPVGQGAAWTVSFVGGSLPVTFTVAYYGMAAIAEASEDKRSAGRVATALIAGSLVTGSLKFAFGRARPFVSADRNAADFKWGRGWLDDTYQSFPSGHTTVAFAFAAALSREYARWHGRSRGVDAALYGGASLVGLSRMVLDKHWASDVLVGALIGTASGVLATPGAR